MILQLPSYIDIAYNTMQIQIGFYNYQISSERKPAISTHCYIPNPYSVNFLHLFGKCVLIMNKGHEDICSREALNYK